MALAWCLPLHALTLQPTASMSFGMTDYTLPLSGALSMGTNGVIAYTGSFNGGGLGTAGQVELQDANGTVLEISCEGGTLAHANGMTLPVEVTAVVGSGNVANWGATPVCAGLGNGIATHTVTTGTPHNMLYLGGRMVPGAIAGGGFSTLQSGGQAIQVRVIVL